MKIRPRILIVEDDVDDEALLMRQLKKAELHDRVHTIRDGRKALEFINDEGGDLSAIFLDLNLPNVIGIRILKAIRQNERTQHLPVIIMTSSNSPQELEECRRLGVSSYVQKPLTFSTFAKAFADSFEDRRNGRFSSAPANGFSE